jgi:hypothetical protein
MYKSLILLITLFSYGCVLTKVISVPLRVGGAVISVIPIVGEDMDDAIDKAADTIDDIPI